MRTESSTLSGDVMGARQPSSHRSGPVAGNSGLLSGALGAVIAVGFYALVATVPWAPLQRYFLGHPVAIAATVLFWIAVAILAGKWWLVSSQWSRLDAIRDEDLLPPEGQSTPAGRWLNEHDAGHVARSWIGEIERLPIATRASHLVQRLQELLTRQTQRGSTKHLADDLRELSGRDADAAHDSLGLVRIIIWAIPMLGFLGTVIGITQTLGGLDFTEGTAAVDRLKSGLYVAFDTTALGLVLSVVAIFLQFPVESSEQKLLAAIDARVGNLVSAWLPSDDASDNQTALIADLCAGIQAAVAESLASQADLWRQTIDEAHQHWCQVNEDNANKITDALQATLTPALQAHAGALSEHANQFDAALQQHLPPALRDHAGALGEHAGRLTEHQHALSEHANQFDGSLRDHFAPALRDHAGALGESARAAGDRLESQCQQWRETMTRQAGTLSAHQQTLIEQSESLGETHQRAEAIVAMQTSLDANLQRLTETNAAIDRSVSAAAGDGMADAMRILARAVDVLTARLPYAAASAARDNSHPRRAA